MKNKVINVYCNMKTLNILYNNNILKIRLTIGNIIKMYKLVDNRNIIINVIKCEEDDYKKFKGAGIKFGRIPKNIIFKKNVKNKPKEGDEVTISIKPYKGKVARGRVKRVLTRKRIHTRGHKVILESGEIGRII